MNVDFSDGEKALQQTARDYLTARAPLQLCRAVLESGSGSAPDLWQGAAEMGWLGTAIPEDLGGAGFGYLELALIAEEVGRALAERVLGLPAEPRFDKDIPFERVPTGRRDR